MMDPIHWFPGHMAKAKRQLAELIRFLDVILEIRDARIPRASHNGDLDALLERRPTVIVLNKADLAEPAATGAWQQWFLAQGTPAISVNGKNGQGIKEVWKLLGNVLPGSKFTRARRVGVVGIPNVGKSTILNRMLGTGAAKTGNLPGITRGKQWIKREGFEILDTPGLLPPKIVSAEDGLKLAWVGTIRDEIIPSYDLALQLMERYGEAIFGWEKAGLALGSIEEKLDWFARKRGFLVKGGDSDIHRGAITLLKEFRDGRLGRISLERPSDDLSVDDGSAPDK